MYLEPQTHRDTINRIHRIIGRFNSFEKMLLQKDAYDILVQLLAMQGSFNRFSEIMNDACRMDVNINLHTPLPVNLQTPERLRYIESIKVQLSKCTTQQLVQIMYTLKHQKNNA